MYSLLWRSLPGGTATKTIICIILFIAVFFLLMQVVFPWVSTLMPYNDVSV